MSGRLWLKPSLADCALAALFLWLIVLSVSSETGLLQDANTGYHIRTGDYIREHRTVPSRDIFSFTKPGEPWFAWEWLAALLMSWLHSQAGMRGLILLSAAAICVTNLVCLRHMLWRGANALIAIAVLHLLIASSSIHYLARPHLFSLLFFAIGFFLLDRDRAKPARAIWWVVPLTALWANLHGAFLGMVASLVIVAAGSALEKNWTAARRYGLLSLASLAASGLNPYGFREHLHAITFLRQKWVLELVQEYGSPKFHSLEGRYFEVMLISGIGLAVSLLARKQIASALLVLAWAHLSLTSVRHIPIYAMVAAPLLAGEATRLWDRWIAAARPGPASLAGILASLAKDHTPHLRRVSAWAILPLVLFALTDAGLAWPTDFPEPRYPANLANRHADLLSGARLFTTDSWADYLNYRFYPKQRIFVDGRCDFFGQQMSEQYLGLLNGHFGWDRAIQQWDLRVALIPSQSGLASLLRRETNWKLIEDTGHAALFVRQ
ncbi:MAG: hypothetical protein ACRD8O_10075 [Bryobacteraceae bacterium]